MREAASWITRGFVLAAVRVVVALRVASTFGAAFFAGTLVTRLVRGGADMVSVFPVAVLEAVLEVDAVCGVARSRTAALLDPVFVVCRLLVTLVGLGASSDAGFVPFDTAVATFGVTVALVGREAAVRAAVVRLWGTVSPLVPTLVVLVFRDISSTANGYHACLRGVQEEEK